MELEGRVAVVTGAGSGIGRATARALDAAGCRVALVDLGEQALAETAAMLGNPTSAHVADVTDEQRMLALAEEVVAAHGAAHVVVNNAGVTAAGRFEDDDLDVLRWLVDVNVWGVVHGCKAFLPVLRAQDAGHVVNLSSMVAFVGLPRNAGYALTKGAVRSFSEALRAELVTSNVGVTSVHPGSIRTNIMASARGSQGALLAELGTSDLAARFLRSPDAVARAIVRGIRRNRARVVVGPDARALDLVARLLPGRSGLVGRAVDRLA